MRSKGMSQLEILRLGKGMHVDIDPLPAGGSRDPRDFVVNVRTDRCDVFVGRPSIYGNPFSERRGTLARFRVANRVEALMQYEAWLMKHPGLLERVKRDLPSKLLGCYCWPDACHAEILARIANRL